VRVLYSFPHKLGADRICHTAWQQVNGVADAGAEVVAFPGVLHQPLHPSVRVHPTLARGRARLPYQLLGSVRTLALHDYIVARRLEKLGSEIDIIHCWPMASLHTLKAAARLGIPTVLERPNAYTRYVYKVVQQECDRLGVKLPAEHENAYKDVVLEKEEEEYHLATRLLCPSDFVMRTFLDAGYSPERLARHQYGFDDKTFHPGPQPTSARAGLRVLFVGVCSPKKGLHYALEAWLRSPAHSSGKFQIAGEFLPAYAEKLAPKLTDSSVQVLGQRKDIAELMRQSDVLILPTVEEGSALVTSEARGSGCVLVVSEAAGAICKHMENALVHAVGDVPTLTKHITMLHENRDLLRRLRTASLSSIHEITWAAAGRTLFNVYRETIESRRESLAGAVTV
jgi:glycosyltransferase involved in cell wall biosynthesis